MTCASCQSGLGLWPFTPSKAERAAAIREWIKLERLFAGYEKAIGAAQHAQALGQLSPEDQAKLARTLAGFTVWRSAMLEARAHIDQAIRRLRDKHPWPSDWPTNALEYAHMAHEGGEISDPPPGLGLPIWGLAVLIAAVVALAFVPLVYKRAWPAARQTPPPPRVGDLPNPLATSPIPDGPLGTIARTAQAGALIAIAGIVAVIWSHYQAPRR